MLPKNEFIDIRDPLIELVTPDVAFLNAQNLSKSNNYTDPAGAIGVRQEVVRFLSKKLDYELDPTRLILTNGADQALCIGIRTVCSQPGDGVIIPVPYYYKYPHQVRLFHGQPQILSPGCGLKFDVNDLERSITSQTKLVLFNTPNNPSGLLYSQEELREILEYLFSRKIHVVLDIVYSSIVFDRKDQEELKMPPGLQGVEKYLWIVDALSKSHSVAGWRIGFLYCPVEHFDQARLHQRFNTSNLSTISQFSIQNILNQRELVHDLIVLLIAHRDMIFNLLQDNAPEIFQHSELPQAGIFAFLNIRSILGETGEFNAEMSKRKLLAMPGSDFGKSAYLRVPLTLKTQCIIQAIHALTSNNYG